MKICQYSYYGCIFLLFIYIGTITYKLQQNICYLGQNNNEKNTYKFKWQKTIKYRQYIKFKGEIFSYIV